MAHEPNPMHHVKDTPRWAFFDRLFGDEVAWDLPSVHVFGHDLQLTKFMIIELVVAVLMLAIFIPIARRARNGDLPKGRFWNAFESLLTFVRNEIARPTIGEREADRYLPFLWTLFIFILFCNLIGLIPFLGSPTASIWATGALALCSFVMMHGAAVVKMGLEEADAHHHNGHGHGEDGHHHGSEGHGHGGGPGALAGLRKVPILGPIVVGLVYYLRSLWPHFEIVPFPDRKAPGGVTASQWVTWFIGFDFGLILSGMIFGIELMGTVIKSGVLAVRLFANMFAGHMVLAMILFFIYLVGNAGFSGLWVGVTAASVIGVVALSLLELFVAFLQAYIFTFLTALFMGMSLHPQH